MSTSTKTSTPVSILRSHESDWALLKISCPVGTKMMAMEGNPDWGGDENEFLLGRNIVLIINSITNLDNETDIAKALSVNTKITINVLAVYDLSLSR
jgi:hypothetical protein